MDCCILSFSELRRKEVINITTGVRLGCICDLEFDSKCGRILSFTVPERTPIFSFKKQEEFRIPWDCVAKIGDDIILVTNACPINKETNQ